MHVDVGMDLLEEKVDDRSESEASFCYERMLGRMKVRKHASRTNVDVQKTVKSDR